MTIHDGSSPEADGPSRPGFAGTDPVRRFSDYCRYSVCHGGPGDGRRRQKRWLEVTRLDAKGGGKVADPLRVDFLTLPHLDDAPDRTRCLQSGEVVEITWAGEKGPRITMLPLFSDSRSNDEGVIEIHSDMPLFPMQ